MSANKRHKRTSTKAGHIWYCSPQILACDILRQLAAEAREFPGHQLTLAAHPQVMAILEKDAPRLLKRLAKEHQVKVTLSPQPQFARDHYVLTHEWPG